MSTTYDQERKIAEWFGEACGLPYVALRDPVGLHWCGYVGIPSSHPLFQKSHHDLLVQEIAVHRGITYSGRLKPHFSNSSYWWFGFDCAHAGDESPGLTPYSIVSFRGIYRDLTYVIKECESLADQLTQGATL